MIQDANDDWTTPGEGSNPQKDKMRRLKIHIILSYFLSIVVNGPLLFGWKTKEINSLYEPWLKVMFMTCLSNHLFLGYHIILGAVYGCFHHREHRPPDMCHNYEYHYHNKTA